MTVSTAISQIEPGLNQFSTAQVDPAVVQESNALFRAAAWKIECD